MVTIGNDTLPGTILEIESARSSGINIGAPGTPVFIGQAYLSASNGSGSASAAEAEEIRRPNRAAALFGDRVDSQLTRAVQDALVEGAYPVYAIAATPNEHSSEDLSSGSGQSLSVANAPVLQVEDEIDITINSTSKDVSFYTDGDPSNASPEADEVLLNPVTGNAYADEAVGNAGDEISYWSLDYADALDEITDAETQTGFVREIVDFVGITDENGDVIDSLETEVDDMESNGYLASGVSGTAGGYVDDAGTTTDETNSYSDSYDNSRVKLINPSRDGDGNTAIGSYVGELSRVGIDSTPIFNRLSTQTQLQTNLTTAQQENLVLAKVNPLKESSSGARIIEDVTTVADDNTDEAAWQQGISRLVTDFVAETIDERSEPYVGEFNNQHVRNAFRAAVSSELEALYEANAIEDYSLVVEEIDNVTAAVDVGIDTADPLRNIEITVSAGNVEGGTQVEG